MKTRTKWLKPCTACCQIAISAPTCVRVHCNAPRNSTGARLRRRPLPLMRKHINGAGRSKMRVLMISKALVLGTAQRKLEELAKCPGVELTLVTPEYWQSDDGSKQVLEPLYTSGYRMIVTPMTLNGNFHLHYYPPLRKLIPEEPPTVAHTNTHPHTFATF